MMKRIIARCLIIICMVAFLFGCVQEKVPGIKFATRVYKFGDVIEGDEVSFSFTYLNSGTDTLVITEVTGTCGCTVPGDYTKEVAPGKTGEIPIVFHSSGFEGDVVKTIKVKTNIPESEPINLTLEGTIRVILKVTPRDLWLGQVRTDSPPLTGIVNIQNRINTPLALLKAYPSGKNCTTKVNTIRQGEEYEIVITVDPPFKLEQSMEILTIETNIKGREKIEIKYHYYGVPDIEVYPEEILIYREQLQPDTSRIVTVRNHLDTPIEIINPRFHGENMAFRIEDIDPDKQIFIIFKQGFAFLKDDPYTFSFEVKHAKGKVSFTIPIQNGSEW